MNGTMLSQIVWAMFVARHCMTKVAKNCEKKPKSDFHVIYYTGSDDSGSDNKAMVSLAGGKLLKNKILTKVMVFYGILF